MKKITVFALALFALALSGCGETNERGALMESSKHEAQPLGDTRERFGPLWTEELGAPDQITSTGTLTLDSVVVYTTGDRRVEFYGELYGVTYCTGTNRQVYAQIMFKNSGASFPYFNSWVYDPAPDFTGDAGDGSHFWVTGTYDLGDGSGSSGGWVECPPGGSWPFDKTGYYWPESSPTTASTVYMLYQGYYSPFNSCATYDQPSTLQYNVTVTYR